MRGRYETHNSIIIINTIQDEFSPADRVFVQLQVRTTVRISPSIAEKKCM